MIAWSSTGDEVFLSGGERFKGRMIVRYRLGDELAAPLHVEVGDFYGMAAG
jgi:hypothetical protein